MPKYKISEYAKIKGVTPRTVWRWIKEGKVQIESEWINKQHTNRVVIPESDLLKVVVYARVSSSENKDNLDRQAERMVTYANASVYPVAEIVKEVGTGLNDHRPKLVKLLKDPSINLIVVEHKDRLTRFGFNYIETLLNLQNRGIEIVNPVTDEKDDLMSDFVSIITSFCARLYGQRCNKHKTEQLIKQLQQETE